MDNINMSTAGFYNNQGFWTPHRVTNADFDLINTLKDTYTYPVYGWTWYNSVEEAQAAEGFDISVIDAINAEVSPQVEEGVING